MAATSFFRARSDSLPTKPHPLMSQLDDQISRLRSSEATCSCISSTSIANNLSDLQDLHECVEKLLHLPLTQQALAQHQNRKWVDELLDGSLRLLDVCNASKDALLQTKEYCLELESTIRRRQGGEFGIAIEVRKYLTSRKMAKKSIQKALNNLKSLEKKCFLLYNCIDNSNHNNNEIATIVHMLREVEAITLSVFKSFLSFISGAPKGQLSKSSSHWSLVSKLMIRKRIASQREEEETDANEFAMADSALESLVGSKFDNLENVQTHLKNLGLCIQHLEDGTHSLFRRLIKTRVSLLNIFN